MKKTHLAFDGALKPYIRYCTLKTIAVKEGAPVRNKTQADPWPSFVISLGPAIHLAGPDGGSTLPKAAAFGAGETPGEVEFRPGHRHLTFSFFPGKAHPFFGSSLREFTDRAVPLSECWGQEGRILEERIQEFSSPAQVKAVIEAELLRRLNLFEGYPAAVQASLQVGLGSKGRASVGALAAAGGCSPAHLKRLFTQWVGLTPKVFARIIRFQALCDALSPAEKPNWAGLSYDFGYSHQSPLIRDFQDFAGESPLRFYESVVIPASLPNSPLKAFQPDPTPFHAH